MIHASTEARVGASSPGNWLAENAANRASTRSSASYLQPVARFSVTRAVIASVIVTAGLTVTPQAPARPGPGRIFQQP